MRIVWWMEHTRTLYMRTLFLACVRPLRRYIYRPLYCLLGLLHGPPNGPVLFCSLASIGVCRLSSSVTLQGARAVGLPTPHGGPVVLRQKTVIHPRTNRPIVRRPGIELTTIEAQVRRPNHSTTEPPMMMMMMHDQDYLSSFLCVLYVFRAWRFLLPDLNTLTYWLTIWLADQQVVIQFWQKASSPSCHPSPRRMDSSDLTRN